MHFLCAMTMICGTLISLISHHSELKEKQQYIFICFNFSLITGSHIWLVMFNMAFLDVVDMSAATFVKEAFPQNREDAAVSSFSEYLLT